LTALRQSNVTCYIHYAVFKVLAGSLQQFSTLA
jgi:hypothetical protein